MMLKPESWAVGWGGGHVYATKTGRGEGRTGRQGAEGESSRSTL